MPGDASIWGLLVDWLAGACLIGGAFFYLVGMIGLHRFPDVFTRMHAVSVSETLGAGLLIAGMILLAGVSLVAVKLVFLMVLILYSGPVIGHALARAALHDGQKPLIADARGNLRETDPADLYPELRERLGAPLTSETADNDIPGPLPAEGGPSSNS